MEDSKAAREEFEDLEDSPPVIPTSAPRFDETVFVETDLLDAADSPGLDDVVPCYRICRPCCAPRYWVRAHSGTDAFSLPGDSQFGALYGVDAGVMLANCWSVIGTVNVDHVPGGTLASAS